MGTWPAQERSLQVTVPSTKKRQAGTCAHSWQVPTAVAREKRPPGYLKSRVRPGDGSHGCGAVTEERVFWRLGLPAVAFWSTATIRSQRKGVAQSSSKWVQEAESWGVAISPCRHVTHPQTSTGLLAPELSCANREARRVEGVSHRGTGDGQQAPGWAVVSGGTRHGAGQLCLVAEFSCWAFLAPEMAGPLGRGRRVRWASFSTSDTWAGLVHSKLCGNTGLDWGPGHQNQGALQASSSVHGSSKPGGSSHSVEQSPLRRHVLRSCQHHMAAGWRCPAQGSGGPRGTAHRPQPAWHPDSGGRFP